MSRQFSNGLARSPFERWDVRLALLIVGALGLVTSWGLPGGVWFAHLLGVGT
jgi:hypothetical protein